MKEINSNILSDITVHMKYAKYVPELNRRETWNELVDRNIAMHIKKYPKLEVEIRKAYSYVYAKKILPSMRSLQFAGKPIEISPNRLYNCSYLPVDDIEAFNEIMFLLLSGCGVGYSVQQHHIKDLPVITKPYMKIKFKINLAYFQMIVRKFLIYFKIRKYPGGPMMKFCQKSLNGLDFIYKINDMTLNVCKIY